MGIQGYPGHDYMANSGHLHTELKPILATLSQSPTNKID